MQSLTPEQVLKERCAALEVELRNVRELSEVIYRGLSIGVFLVQVDEHGEFRSLGFNNVLERAIGVSSASCMGKRPTDLVPHVLNAEHAKFMTQQYQRCVDARELVEYEQYIEFYAKPSWWLTRLTPIINGEGRVVRIVGSCWEDSARKKLEQENQERQQRFRAVFESSLEPKFLFDDFGRFIDFNSAATELLGYTREELLALRVSDVLSPGQTGSNDFVRSVDETATSRSEFLIHGKCGRAIWVEQETVQNVVPGVHLSVCRDLSTRKAAEETIGTAMRALESAHSRLNGMIEAIPHPIAAFDRNSIVVACNQSYRKVFEKMYAKSIAEGDDIAQVLKHLPVDLELANALVKRAAEGDVFSLAAEFGDPRIGRRVFQVALAPVRDASGATQSVVFTAQDLTERSQVDAALRESEARYRDLAANVPGVIFEWVVSEDGRNGPRYLSPRVQELFGVPNDHPAQLLERMSDVDRVRLTESAREAAQVARVWTFDAWVRDAQGEAHWVSGIARPADVTPKRVVFNGVLLDETDRRNAEQQLEMAATVFEASRDGILILDAFGNAVRVNAAFANLTGYSIDEMKGRESLALLADGLDVSFVDRLWERTLEDNEWHGEMMIRRADGSNFPAEVHCRTVRSARDRVQSFVLFIADISERKANEERIRNLAQHDHLTGLPNRALLEDRLRQALSHADRTRTRLALLFIDLDHFKSINDTHGHNVGDLLLVQVASRLTGCVRVADTVSRQGGDEFVVLITDLESTDAAAGIAKKILDVLAEPFVVANQSLTVTASVGIATFPDDSEDTENLFKHADAAMYHAKSVGRNGYQFFTQDLNTRVHERAAAEARVRRALRAQEFSLHYHPRVRLGDDQLVAIEALVRWTDPEVGPLQPDALVALADSCGLGGVLGESVLNEACRQVRQWQRAGLTNVPIAVNVSAGQFCDTNFVATVRTALDRSGLSPTSLCLEVPESVLMNDVEFSRTLLGELAKIGVAVIADQLGGGFSSAWALRRLPIHSAQLSRSLLADAPTNDEHASIAGAIASMAHALGLSTVAVNVESEAHARLARQLGCTQAQGYWFAKPMPPYECERWLKSARRDSTKH